MFNKLDGAKKYVKECIQDAFERKDGLALGYYNGVFDITAGMNFSYIADEFDLTQRQYDSLINYGQKLAEKLGNKII